MGVKIVGEDGVVLHEFKDGLGVPLLLRIVGRAKFSKEPDPLIVLNPHVAELARALDGAMQRILPTTTHASYEDLAPDIRWQVTETLYREVEAGRLKWLKWLQHEKISYVRDILIAPWSAPREFIEEFVSEADHYFDRVRRALNDQ
jgi:hypothetical protein